MSQLQLGSSVQRYIDLVMVDFKDYYKVLGLKQGAVEAEIKDAFKKLAKQYHPDSSTGDEEKFKEINEAYEVLKDHNKRSKYDSMFNYRNNFENMVRSKSEQFKYKNATASKDFSGFNSLKETLKYAEEELSRPKPPKNKKEAKFSDFFELLFGRQQEQQAAETTSKAQIPIRGEDYEMEIELTLEEASSGTVRRIEISSGPSRKIRKLEVTIPPGVRESNKIKIRSEGKPGQNGGPNGDLYLKVHLKEHPIYEIEGDDIHSELILRPEEALLGCEKYIPTLEGVVELVIPPNTQNATILRLKGKGLKSSKEGTSGDHFVHSLIQIPVLASPEELDLYRKLQDFNPTKKKNNEN